MAGGWQPLSTVQPGVRQGTVTLECGDARTWSITVPSQDLTGYTAEWLLGTPPSAQLLGLVSGSYTPSSIAVKKTTTDNSLALINTAGGWVLRFTLTKADTIGMTPRSYWQQAVVFDATGNPVTVAEGPVSLIPSLLAIEPA